MWLYFLDGLPNYENANKVLGNITISGVQISVAYFDLRSQAVVAKLLTDYLKQLNSTQYYVHRW